MRRQLYLIVVILALVLVILQVSESSPVALIFLEVLGWVTMLFLFPEDPMSRKRIKTEPSALMCSLLHALSYNRH